VAYLIGTGRWGSHIGWWRQNIYVTDIALVLTFLWCLVRHRSSIRLTRPALLALLPILGMVAWAVVRFVLNTTLDPEALRDLAPFIYASVAAVGLVRVDQAARKRTLVAIEIALVLHAIWVTAALHFPIATRYPLSGGLLYIFEIRADFDSSMLAVMSGLALFGAIRVHGWGPRLGLLLLAAWPAWIVLEIGSRAGALALLASAIVVTATAVRRGAFTKRRLVLVATITVALCLVVLPRTSLYARLTGDSRFAVNSAAGTTSARELAWTAVLDYVNESPTRVAFGVGPGPDYLVASGARPYFGSVHQGDIRVPHNILLSYYARLGLIGLLLFTLVICAWLRASWSALTAPRRDEVSVAYVLITATLLLTSFVGVVLESPFGAVPFFWATGQLLVMRITERR
jgi:O-antigen ligase